LAEKKKEKREIQKKKINHEIDKNEIIK